MLALLSHGRSCSGARTEATRGATGGASPLTWNVWTEMARLFTDVGAGTNNRDYISSSSLIHLHITALTLSPHTHHLRPWTTSGTASAKSDAAGNSSAALVSGCLADQTWAGGADHAAPTQRRDRTPAVVTPSIGRCGWSLTMPSRLPFHVLRLLPWPLMIRAWDLLCLRLHSHHVRCC